MSSLAIVILILLIYCLAIFYTDKKIEEINNEYRKELAKTYKKQAKFYKEICDILDEIRKKENK